MILYHGTNIDFQKIDIRESNPYKDFEGFYLTDIFLQAENMANKKARILGGKPVILKYQFDEAYLTDSSLNILIFEKPDKEYYDIVIGPIADDGVAYLLNRYEEGFCTLEELAKDLKYKKLNRQFFFGTMKSIALLTRIPWHRISKNI